MPITSAWKRKPHHTHTLEHDGSESDGSLLVNPDSVGPYVFTHLKAVQKPEGVTH